MSEGIFNSVPSSNKWGKLLPSTFFHFSMLEICCLWSLDQFSFRSIKIHYIRLYVVNWSFGKLVAANFKWLKSEKLREVISNISFQNGIKLKIHSEITPTFNALSQSIISSKFDLGAWLSPSFHTSMLRSCLRHNILACEAKLTLDPHWNGGYAIKDAFFLGLSTNKFASTPIDMTRLISSGNTIIACTSWVLTYLWIDFIHFI